MDEDLAKQPTLPGVAPAIVKEPETTPTQIGPYKIEGRLGKGGMSRLYLAIDPKSHDPLAIKVLSPEYVSHPEMKERFLREARIISLTDHPNIVKLYGEGEWEGGLYIAMEFVQGISLRQFILQHTMSLKRALELVVQISSAIDHLHSHDVIHRDLKPENILLTSDGGVKVIDFGIAMLHEEESREGGPRVVGTPVYMAPEQRDAPASASYPADIYSLGILTYELVLGRLSYGTVHISEVPRSLQKILSKALQPNPAKRYRKVAEFVSDIEDYLASDKVVRDQRGRGYTQDLAEHLRTGQDSILPRGVPHWREVAIGLASHRDLNISGVFYDFLELEEGAYGILLAEPSSRGVEGVLHSALLQGMVHALAHRIRDPADLVNAVNACVANHPIDEIFTLNLLIFSPRQNELRYLSCGYGPLWVVRAGTTHADVIHSENIAIGIDPAHNFLTVARSWHVGDSIFLSTFHPSGGEEGNTEKNFTHAVEELIYTSPQKQADGLLRRLLNTESTKLRQRPATIITIQRTA